MLHIFTTGFTLGFSLILAIGAQNAFVLRQGLRNEHIFAVCLTCAFSDAILILFGITGFRQILQFFPWIDPLMRYAGAAFLIYYGIKSLCSAIQSNHALIPSNDDEKRPLKRVLLICLAFTWLNPHVYLDTVVLIGTISTQFAGQEYLFAAGAMTASFIFFFALGYGARLLTPLFSKPKAWKILELLIALLMWFIAAKLLFPF